MLTDDLKDLQESRKAIMDRLEKYYAMDLAMIVRNHEEGTPNRGCSGVGLMRMILDEHELLNRGEPKCH